MAYDLLLPTPKDIFLCNTLDPARKKANAYFQGSSEVIQDRQTMVIEF